MLRLRSRSPLVGSRRPFLPAAQVLRLSAAAAAMAGSLLLVASSTVVVAASSRLLLPPPPRPRPQVRLLGASGSGLLLSGEDAGRSGRWGLFDAEGGYAQVGAPSPAGEGLWLRPVLRSSAPLRAGTVMLERQAFPSDLDACRVMFPSLTVSQVASPRGTLPLLSSPTGGDVAFVGVHGRGVSPSEWLRVFPQVSQVGWRFASCSFCNDGFGPPVRFSGLGWSEAEDVLLQVDFLASQGVSKVVLGGVSFGGAVVASLLSRYAYRDAGSLMLRLPEGSSAGSVEVVGLVLEAPALDWPEVIGHIASGMHLPPLLAHPVLMLSLLRARLDPGVLRPLVRLDRGLFSGVPLLLMHGTADAVVPVGISDTLASSYPAAMFLRADSVGHAEMFNLRPERYDEAAERFFRLVSSSASRR